jgi:hypothetical protein
VYIIGVQVTTTLVMLAAPTVPLPLAATAHVSPGDCDNTVTE